MTILSGSCEVVDLRIGACQIVKRYIGSCIVWDVSAAVFWGITPDPDTYVMLDVRDGTPPITDARVADIELPDYQSAYQTFGQELAYEGGRVTGAEGSRVVYADDGVDPLAEVPWLVHAPQATNYFLNSHAPASQTVSGRTGSHTVWIEGSGSVAVTGGITDTVTDGSPLTGDPGGSDVILTVTGVPDFVQFENNAFPTFPIETAGAAVTRDACDIEIPSINHSDQGDRYTLEVVVTGGPCNVLGTFLQYDGANFVLTDGTNSQSVAAAIGEHSVEIDYSAANGTMTLSVDGVPGVEGPYSGILLWTQLKPFLDSPYVGKIRNIVREGNQSTPLSPLDIPDCVGWFDFDDYDTLSLSGSDITQVENKADPTRPLVNLQGTVTYSPTALNGKPAGVTNGAKMVSDIDLDGMVFTFVMVSSNDSIVSNSLGGDPGAGMVLRSRVVTGLTFGGRPNGAPYVSVTISDVDAPLVSVGRSPTGSSIGLSFNAEPEVTESAVLGAHLAVNAVAVGNTYPLPGTDLPINGPHSEIIIYSRSITDEESIRLRLSLMQKWGIS